MKIQLPVKVKKIISRLEEAGFEAFAVGGCVRDSILQRTPADWDITTSALPSEVKAIFPHTVDTGIAHGTVTVIQEHEGFEVTTYRIDGEYQDNRHPKSVSFTSDLTKDLERRDFTINAMAYNDRCGLVDVFGGMEDLEEGIIRCVGDARERFTEDALRILRAVRFAAQLGFEIEEQTQRGASLLAGNLKDISAERIQTELVKLVTSPYPGFLETAYRLGITKIILPEFDACMETEQNNPYHCYNVGVHTLRAMEYVDADKVLRLAVLFHDIGKPLTHSKEDGVDHFHGHQQKGMELTVQIMKRLKFDNDTLDKVKKLVYYHDVRLEPDKKQIRRMMNKTGEELFPLLLEIFGADILAKSEYRKVQDLVRLNEVTELYEEIVADRECVNLKMLAVSGKDLIEAGMRPGKELGNVLNLMLEDVLNEPQHNEKEYLISRFVRL